MDAAFFSHVMLWVTVAITAGGAILGLGAVFAMGRNYKN